MVILPNHTAYLQGSQAAVTFADKQLFSDTEKEPITNPIEKLPRIVPWGPDDDLPIQIINRVEKNPMLSTAMLFNILATTGQSVVPVRYNKDTKEWDEVLDNQEINDFLRDNDIDHYLLEQIVDVHYFYNNFPEIILNRKGDKIVSLSHKEAAFSRWSEMDKKTGNIDYHFYSAKFGTSDTPDKDDIIPTKALDSRSPLRDLKIRLGLLPDKDGKNRAGNKITKDRRFVIPLNFPTPGRFYYQKPYWYSIIESGWVDFADKIPEFKKAIMSNQATIKYHIQLHPDYFKVIFEKEGITSDQAKAARIKKEYESFDNFLKDTKNSGKSVISYRTKEFSSGGGVELEDMMKITAVESSMKGGEYIDDLEEVTNIISYSMMVHPSVIGASPGKSKNINGTEARELFIIKQALLKPFRKLLLKPLYFIKWFNNWPEDIHFAIPDTVLTTLDKNKTGSETQTDKS